MQIFCALTKVLEGNIASGLIILAQYLRVYEDLLEIQNPINFPTLPTMIDFMLVQLMQYQSEYVNADVIVLFTILNPNYQPKLLDLHYPQHSSQAKEVIKVHFNVALES